MVGEKIEDVVIHGSNEKVIHLKESVHPLKNKWRLWYFCYLVDLTWEENLKLVVPKPICDVEEFWAVYRSIKRVSEIKLGRSYFLFKDGIKPEWEAKENREGGRWIVTFDKSWRGMLDDNWLEVLLCLIGEAFGVEGEDVCGAVVDARGKLDRISIWTRYSKNKDVILKIGKLIKERLQLGPNVPMVYEKHSDAFNQNKIGSRTKPMYVL